MENSNKIIPPHLNAEVYRTDTTGTSTISYLDYLRLHSDGSILIGCSELTGRYWNGGASIYQNKIDVQKMHSDIKRSIPLTSGSADGYFIQASNKVLVCEDSGAVSVWSNSDNEQPNVWQQWLEDISVSEHDEAALAVDCLDPGSEYVTVGADGNAKVWDINEMICIRNYNAAHSRAIYGVSVKPKSTTNFATGSLDQYVTLWDVNVDEPVLDLIRKCSIRCLQWVDENRLLFGDEAGVLSLVDVRNSKTQFTIAEFPAAVHKLEVHPECDVVAVCCDNKIVSVCDISNNTGKVIYHDRHIHSNYVRGLAWDVEDNKMLHTVGWDGQLKSHKIEWN